MTEAQTSVGDVVVSLSDNILENMEQNLAEPGFEAHEDNLDCDAEAPMVKESFYVIPSTDDQSPPIAWTEPKRGRKIETTSLQLRRRKKDKRRHKKKRVLRLRGGGGDDDEEEDDGDEINSNHEKRKSEEPSTTENKETSSKVTSDKEAMQEAKIDKEAMREAEAISKTEDDNKGGDVNEACVLSHVDVSFLPLRLSGSGGEHENGKRPRESGSECDFVPVQHPKRPKGWGAWEDKTKQRPAPLNPPRDPEMEYANMTVRAIEDEDGISVFSQYKDRYMRSEVQLQAISDAHKDQRKVAGGVYRCLEKNQEMFELVIQKGFKSKTLGVVLRRRAGGKAFSVFESFADMKYEYFKLCNGRRVRKEWPEMTTTGFTWTGFGAEMALPDMPSSSIFVFCERVDRDLHFSQGPCERISEAPGASQRICSSAACGVVSWHLSRKCFQLGSDGQFGEAWQDDFCLVTFKSNQQKLLWTHPNRKLKTSWWERYDSSAQYNAFIPDAGTRRRVQENLSKLPPWHFAPPTYTPQQQFWTDPSPLEREADNSCW